MPEFVREKALRLLNRLGVAPCRATVLVLGVAYKRDLSDCRESPAIQVIRLLREDGANVLYHDPYVPAIRETDLKMESQPLSENLVSAADLVITTTGHTNIDYGWVVEHARHVFDTVTLRGMCGISVNESRLTIEELQLTAQTAEVY